MSHVNSHIEFVVVAVSVALLPPRLVELNVSSDARFLVATYSAACLIVPIDLYEFSEAIYRMCHANQALKLHSWKWYELLDQVVS